MASGLRMVKKELGPDALILSTKTVRNGKLGLLSKAMVEITAAIDNDFQEPEKTKEAVTFSLAPDGIKETTPPRKTHSFRHVVDDSVDEYLHYPTDSKKKNACFSEHPTANIEVVSDEAKQPEAKEKSATIQNEVNELKQLVKSLAGQISTLHNQEKSPKKTDRAEPRPIKAGVVTPTLPFRVTVNHFMAIMTARGINQEIARNIAGSMRTSLSEDELNNTAVVDELLNEKLQHLIKVDPPNFSAIKEQQRISLVGATGVGKTTTLAKIAASYLDQQSNSVALITIDTYRIAAVEQLKVYGEIMNIPVDVVITPDQLGKALQKHKDKKLILIDTAGRSPKDSLSIDELNSFFRPEYKIEKHLVLSATTRENEVMDTIRQFSKTSIAKTIFTKIDECTNLGVLLNTQLSNPSPISYITNGQRVPEDLLDISPKKIAELIMSQEQGSMNE